MKKHSLYYSKYCYFCQKVLMFLNGHQHPVELLSTAEADHRAALVQGGGKSQVPCLRIDSANGVSRWMYESDEILDYLKDYQPSATG
ncbi:MAG: glutathione S-transferase domain-containing protein [Gammaproteobacteria bacterium]|nr:glutathione S-transferase domain-containing protein [Gammaproteobacteria bacterium]